MPEQKSAFDTPWFNAQDAGWFNQLNKSKIPRLVLTAETEDFDEEVVHQFRDEGFDTAYVPLLNGGNDFVDRVHRAGDSFGVGEYYGIVAYGDAASLMLEAHLKPNNPRLVAVIAYYPSTIPSVNTKFPPSVKVLVHLAGAEIGVRRTTEVLGIQGKRKTVRKRIDPGEGHGGSLKLGYQAYTYGAAEPGFAEHDLEEFEGVAEGVAFTRTLATLRRAFRIEGGVEGVRDGFVAASGAMGGGRGLQREKVVGKLREFARVVHAPTLTGGVGKKDLESFYARFFAPLPASFAARLLSRTIGTDRVVDELFVSFTHSSPVPWILPGIPPTNKAVEIVVVSIVCVRGGRVESEHVYWDQASVLAQIGLINAKAVPEAMKKKGVKSLPIVGAEGARAIKRGSSKQMNALIADW